VSAYVGREPTRTWIKSGTVRALAQSGTKRYAKLPEVPTFYELMEIHKTPDAMKGVTKVLLSSGELGRPFIAPPGTPPDRVKILREAFNKTMTDPILIAETNKRKWDLEPTSGEELEAISKEVMVQPQDVIERVKKVLGN
jgi:tripartite-type tricarboxylate transporter receptor subunit TctC